MKRDITEGRLTVIVSDAEKTRTAPIHRSISRMTTHRLPDAIRIEATRWQNHDGLKPPSLPSVDFSVDFGYN